MRDGVDALPILPRGPTFGKHQSNWRKALELLAKHFLKIAGQEPLPREEADSLARIGNVSSESGWRM